MDFFGTQKRGGGPDPPVDPPTYIMSTTEYYNLLYLFIIGNNYTSVHPIPNTPLVNKLSFHVLNMVLYYFTK